MLTPIEYCEGLAPSRAKRFTPPIILDLRGRHKIYLRLERIRRGKLSIPYSIAALARRMSVLRASDLISKRSLSYGDSSRDTRLRAMGMAAANGVRWDYARPPSTEIEFEMDLRSTQNEVHLV